ncbi:hypothetical protein K505DRAFT_36155 [Melanomma pulvis-pyrius CBS 109.77]|uniref:Uncharacterized protein n=1 Tax=Melanomma pulvis-pyrius CBS 109.77 TaxID=1314802 RepID=A0A6A6XCJ0_9PLEO|nr:hypothetical protein K505DRAFT_36155 [Melanomma pulvis-pyrius CBS 109.77]
MKFFDSDPYSLHARGQPSPCQTATALQQSAILHYYCPEPAYRRVYPILSLLSIPSIPPISHPVSPALHIHPSIPTTSENKSPKSSLDVRPPSPGPSRNASLKKKKTESSVPKRERKKKKKFVIVKLNKAVAATRGASDPNKEHGTSLMMTRESKQARKHERGYMEPASRARKRHSKAKQKQQK